MEEINHSDGYLLFDPRTVQLLEDDQLAAHLHVVYIRVRVSD